MTRNGTFVAWLAAGALGGVAALMATDNLLWPLVAVGVGGIIGLLAGRSPSRA